MELLQPLKHLEVGFLGVLSFESSIQRIRGFFHVREALGEEVLVGHGSFGLSLWETRHGIVQSLGRRRFRVDLRKRPCKYLGAEFLQSITKNLL